MDNLEKYLTLQEASELLQVSPPTFRKLAKLRKIKPVVFVARKLYRQSELIKLRGFAND